MSASSLSLTTARHPHWACSRRSFAPPAWPITNTIGRRSSSSRARAVTIRVADGTNRILEVDLDKQEWTCGSDGAKASLQLGDAAGGVEPTHVRLSHKKGSGKQVFLTALANVDDGVLGDSRAWLDGHPLRPGVSYVIGSGQRVDMGRLVAEGGAAAAAAAFTVEFPEPAGSNPLVEMMMAGMAGSGASGDKLREALKKT